MNEEIKPIIVKGSLKDIEAFREALQNSDPRLIAGNPVPVKETLSERRPMAQIEWFQVLVHFATGLATHGAIELIKALIKKLNDGGRDLKISSE